MRRPAMLVALPLFCLTLATCHDTLGPSPRLPRGGPVALVTVEDTLIASGDTHLSKTSPNQNFGTNGEMRVGGTSRYRALVQFDSAAIRQAVGAGRLDSARVEFTILANPDGFGSGGRQVDLHRMTRSWTELGATWNCPVDANTANSVPDCPGNTWDMTNTGQAPYVTTRTARVTITNGQTGVIRLDVTQDVAGFLAGTVHQGWIFRKYTESENGQALVLSRTTADPPRLILAVTTNPVPAQAPDSVPAAVWAALHDPMNLATDAALGGIPFPRNLIMLRFAPSASQVERQAAVDLVQGTVIGGARIYGSVEYYFVQIQDDGTTTPLRTAIAALSALPSVAAAMVEIAEVVPNWAKPADGPEWTSWVMNQTLADGQNWALERIRAPMAWGCGTSAPAGAVGVVDHGFVALPELTANTSSMSVPAHGQYPGEQHGTTVASILAARGDNGMGMTGVLWQAEVVMHEYFGRHPHKTFAMLGQVARLALLGVRVINLSEGLYWQQNPGRLPDTTSHADSVSVQGILNEATQLITELAADGYRPLLVIAASNDGIDAWWSGLAGLEKAESTQVVVVASSRQDGGLAASSNRGDLVQVAAPGDAVYGLDASGQPVPASGTSFAAPMVTGLAGLLLGLDPTLTAKALDSLIVAGALRGKSTADSIPVIDAYESMRALADRSGTPLCGNRVWAVGDSVFLDRVPTPERLMLPASLMSAQRVVVEHEGRVLSRCGAIWQTCTQLFRHAAGQGWVADTSQTGYSSNSPAFRSEFGRSHDGDSAAVIYPGPTSASFEVHLESPPGAGPGQTLATVTPATPDFGAVVAWHPGRDSLLLGVTTFDASGNVLATTLRKMSRLNGGLSPVMATLPSRELYTAAVSDDGTQFLVQTRTEPAGPCTIEYRDWATGTTVLQSVTQPGGVCQNGTKGTFLRAGLRWR